MKEAADLPIVFWFLHVAACESRLFIHAGRPVGSDPTSPLESGEYRRKLASFPVRKIGGEILILVHVNSRNWKPLTHLPAPKPTQSDGVSLCNYICVQISII